jgi:hypothetical protein
VRHCRQCDLDVHNFSMMSRAEVERLLATKRGRLCGAFFRRADGTIITRDCPVGLKALRARAAWMVARIAAAVGLIVGGALAFGRPTRESPTALRDRQPFALLTSWLSPPPVLPGSVPVAGDIMLAPPARAEVSVNDLVDMLKKDFVTPAGPDADGRPDGG